MKRKLIVSLLLLLGITYYSQAQTIKYSLVKYTDRSKAQSWKLLSAAELKALQAEISAENKQYDKALRETMKAWKKAGNPKTFPRNSVSKRTAKVSGRPYTDMGKGMAKLTEMEEKIEAKAETDAAKIKGKMESECKDKDPATKIRVKKKYEKKARAAADKVAHEDACRVFFEEQLAKLMPGYSSGGDADDDDDDDDDDE